MITSICTLAKQENVYINDWLDYHFKTGYDHIYIYDNNDIDYPLLEDVIELKFKQKLTIIDLRGKSFDTTPNIMVYNDFFKKYAKDVDWVTFIDVDEFAHFKLGSVKRFLLNAPQDARFFCLHTKVFGDDNIIVGDETIPVYKRITKELTNTPFKGLYKSMVKCDSSDKEALNPHCIGERILVDSISYPCYYDSNYDIANINSQRFVEVSGFTKSLDRINNYEDYILHYPTKTLSEFLKYKLNRVDNCYNFDDKMDYFWMFNEKTQDKDEYIKKNVKS